MRYYCIKQHDITDCGVACLATICKQNGYKIGITQISAKLPNIFTSLPKLSAGKQPDNFQ